MKAKGFSEEEKKIVKEYMEEKQGKGVGEEAVLTKIAQMAGDDKILAEKIHKIIMSNAPELTPRTWYGMPAYTNKDGKVVCFFQDAAKFKARYATLGFQHDAKLDNGNMWPVAYALIKLTDVEEKKIAELVKKAVG